MKNNLKTLLLMSTMLVSGFLFGQNNQKTDKKDKLKITAGALNVRTTNKLDNVLERVFVKSTYQLTDELSVSAELGATHFDLVNKNNATFSPSIDFKNKRFEAGAGFFGINNELFTKAKYKFNDNKTALLFHFQNLTTPSPQADFFPSIPKKWDVASLLLVENKASIYKNNNFNIGLIAGLGVSVDQDGNTDVAAKALFLVNAENILGGKGKVTLAVGVQPLPVVGFDERATVLLKLSL